MATVVDERAAALREANGLAPTGTVYWDLSTEALYEHALKDGSARLAHGGALAVTTGVHTGRAPKDKFIVREPGSEGRVGWGAVNQPIELDVANKLGADLRAHLNAQPQLYVLNARVGADPTHGIILRLISESAWHALFTKSLFIELTDEERANLSTTQGVIFHAPSFKANPEVHKTRAENFVVMNLSKGEILIGGTQYAGEIKKSGFTLMNDRLPLDGVLPMHCSANVGADGDVAVFFGLSGTGKTTLSTDSTRPLIGDDEHGWSDKGVFNFEGGCYAKVIGLSAEAEPEIYATTQMFGTVLENVVLDEQTRIIDLDDDSLTENTRGAYPLSSIPNAVPEKRAGQPTNIVMLTCDAFGVLAPIAKLSPEQAMQMFLAGYTAKVAGTEVGVTEPQATFSSCFGAPFLPQPPKVYGELLKDRIERYGVNVWLINTGWTGGGAGVGKRMPIAATRTIVRAALSGELAGATTRTDPIFGFEVPVAIAGVEPALLDPKSTWPDAAAYDETAKNLATDIVAHATKAGQ
jgi:phosphoenolpyruvate carboxykinase (ATP)